MRSMCGERVTAPFNRQHNCKRSACTAPLSSSLPIPSIHHPAYPWICPLLALCCPSRAALFVSSTRVMLPLIYRAVPLRARFPELRRPLQR